jgi:dolichol-phosphate mannosyltransferase
MIPAGAAPELTVAMPAYEEGKNLAVLLPALHEILAALGATYEIVVVDTRTPRDDTPLVCSRWGVRYLRREGGDLYSHALRTALTASRGRFVIIMDADGSHGPSFIPLLWAERDVADLVIASRYVPGGRTENPRILIWLSRAVNLVFRFTLAVPCADVSNSFRLYRGADVRALSLECENFDVVEEILVKLVFTHPGYRLKEVPFTFERRKAGTTKRNLVSFAWGYLATLVRLRRLKRRALAPDAPQ